MKEGWEEKKLKEIAKYRRGSFPQPYGNKDWYDGEDSMPFIQVAELQEDSFNLVPVTKRRISKIAQPLSVFVPAGTVLVSLQGSIGKVAITDYDSYVDRTIAIFQDYKIKIDKTFFAYQLKIRFEIERLKARGTTIKTITKEEFANFIINCPPLSEQQSIVDYLDSAFAKIDAMKANSEKALNEAKALFQKVLEDTMASKEGWEDKPLGDLCDIFGRIGFRGYTTKDLVQSPFDGAISLSPSNIQDGKMDYSKLTYISWFKYEESPEIKIFNGDILLVKTGSSYGKSALVQGLPHEATINPQSVVLKNCKIDNAFFAYQLRTNRVLDEFNRFVSGTAIPTFSQAKLSTVSIQYPTNEKQQSIVDTLDSLKSKVDRLQENYDKISQECDALKQAILRQVFE